LPLTNRPSGSLKLLKESTFKRLLRSYVSTQRELEMIGAADPRDWDAIKHNAKLAKKKFFKYMEEFYEDEEEFGELLNRLDPWLLHERRCGAEAGDESKCDCGISKALAALQSYVSRLREERDRQGEALLMFREEQDRDKATIASLRERVLTKADCAALLDFYDTGNDFNTRLKSALAKLRSLAALRSLEGDKND
jgi:hypothetical protein